MKKMIMVGAILLAAAVSQAASLSSSRYGSSDEVTGLIGFTKSAVNFGVNYEHRLESNLGVGGYFLYSSEHKEGLTGNNQLTSFGAILPAHLIDDHKLDVYLAPGFGIFMVKGLSNFNQDDQTTFGPLWKMGFQYKVASNVKVGLERTEIVNWFTDKLAGNYDYTNFAISFGF